MDYNKFNRSIYKITIIIILISFLLMMPVTMSASNNEKNNTQDVVIPVAVVLNEQPNHDISIKVKNDKGIGINKISPELQQIINKSPDEIVSVTILLKEQPIHSIAKKKQDKYKSKYYEFQDQVQTQFKGARKNASMKKNTDINAHSSVMYDDETSIDIISSLTEIEKHNILETNPKFENARQEMILEILNETKEKIQPQQDKIINKIDKLGGSVEGTGSFYNVVFSKISARNIQEIVDLHEVGYVEINQISKPDMDTSVYSIFANTFWNNGLIGTSFEVGVADSGVDSSHPSLSSRVIAAKDFVPGDSDGNNPDDLHGHGTHVSGTVASTDATYKGIAYGANIINLKIGDSNIGYSAYDSDVMSGVDWAIYGTPDPAEIISHSYSGTVGKSRFFDAVVDDLGLTVSVSAGNDGPTPGTVGYNSYNSIVVGGMHDLNTVNRTDDTIYYYSSRGPVPGTARIKPDIMAPGEQITSAAYYWEGGNPDFLTMSGTSMAAPHISGAAALLMSAGVYNPKAIKALLINAAEDKGTTGGDYDYGWGYVDLNHTFFHTLDVRTGIVNISNRYLLYKGYAFTGDKASLIWNRHVNYSGASYPNIYYSPSDLNLYSYNESNGTLMSYSNSNDENVEQVISNSNTDTVYKVQGQNFASGVFSEEFAFATEEGFSGVNPPILKINISNPNSIENGTNFDLNIIVDNDGGVAAHNVNVTINLLDGFFIISGTNPQSIGIVDAGSSKTATWVVKAPDINVSTLYVIEGNASSFSYGEFFSENGINIITVTPDNTLDTTPPESITNLKNESYAESNINWTWTDPLNPDFSKVMVFLNGIFQTNVSKGIQYYSHAGLIQDTTYIIGTRTVDITGNINADWENLTTTTAPDTSPASITNLRNVSYSSTIINWTWADPNDPDFSKVMVFVNGIFKENITKGVQFYQATGLMPNMMYKISTRTVDITGNINSTWINHTSITKRAITVDDSGGADYTSIQAAIDNAIIGDAIEVRSGTYFENVNVNKQVTLTGIDTGLGQPIVDARGSGHAVRISADRIFMEGMFATNASSGSAGIRITSFENIITGNTANNNGGYGIHLFSSGNNTLSNNNANSNNNYGISLSSFSNNNSLSNNNANSNNNYGISLSDSSNNTLSNNNANDSNNWAGIRLQFSNNNTLSNNNVSNNDYGIWLSTSCNNNTLNNNNASNNGVGLRLASSSNNTLSNNNASNNGIGLMLNSFSNNNTLNSNNASNNDYGIVLYDSSNNTLSNNNANSNNDYGIYLSSSSNSALSNNNASNNDYGIVLYDSSNNTLSNNNANSNNNYGIYLSSSSSSTLSNNYFNNTINFIFVITPHFNNWNTTKTAGINIAGGPHLGGNFWANPSGTGFSQTCTDVDIDGICDSNYTLASGNVDYLPLAVPLPGYINGTVLNNSTGIPGAVVTTDTNVSTIVDGAGFYSLLLEAGTYTLNATSELEYYSNSSVVVNVVSGSTVVQDIELMKKPTGTISGNVAKSS